MQIKESYRPPDAFIYQAQHPGLAISHVLIFLRIAECFSLIDLSLLLIAAQETNPPVPNLKEENKVMLRGNSSLT